MAMGSWCKLDGNADSLKSSARPNNTWFINTRLMSSELRQQERAASELMPEISVLDRFLEVVPVFVEFEVAVPHLSPAAW